MERGRQAVGGHGMCTHVTPSLFVCLCLLMRGIHVHMGIHFNVNSVCYCCVTDDKVDNVVGVNIDVSV